MANCRVCNAELNPDIDWCGQCYTPVEKPGHEPLERPEPVGNEVLPAPEYSAVKAGPYSFGLLGKLILTSLVVGVGAALGLTATRIGSFYGTMGLALVLMFIGIYTVIAVIGLWGIWRPTRIK